MDARAFLARILEQPRVVAVRTVLDTYGRAAGGLLANGLAFSALFAAIPTTLLVLGLAGWVAGEDPTIRELVIEAFIAALPPLADLIRGSVDAVTEGAALTSVVGVVGLVWTVSQLVGAVDVAFARIFSDVPERGALLRTVRGFVVVGLLAATVIVIIASLGLVAALDTLSGTQGSLARTAVGWLGSPPFLAVAASVAVIVCYRKLPPRPPRWRALVLPAVIVGVILVVLSQVFTFLVPRLVGVAELAGSLASGFVALAWLSFSFQALLLGAAWVRVRDAGLPGAVAGPSPSAGSAPLEGAAAPAEPGGRGE
ncbi:MAG: YihY/virulence factor BrkB family protein [Candidatus Limnocylindrales bacterium]|nr:YihY/virulence factor BrkB family protein [Candidatus Limnocylindrales bacterium]